MNFADKLTFLIQLTGSTNKRLADAINLDPSQVSRLRRGVRRLPVGADYLPGMAAYFAHLCKGEEQLHALAEQMQRGLTANGQPVDTATLAGQISAWLAEEDAAFGAADFLRSFEQFQLLNMDNLPHDAHAGDALHKKALLTFYGEEGMQQALDYLLELTLKRGRPTLVQMCSDEGYWRPSAEEFLQRTLPWRLQELSQLGCRFQRIIRPDADLDYTFGSIMLWLPVYLTGAVESFYYPRLRDTVYHRTLVVSHQVGAMFSTSVGAHPRSIVSYLVTERSLVEHYAGEFADYLAMCEMVDKTYNNSAARERLLNIMAARENYQQDSIQRNDALSLISLPQELYPQLLMEKSLTLKRNYQDLLERREAYFANLGTRRFTDIINLAAVEDIRAGRAALSISCNLSAEPRYYQPEQYKLHLRHIVAMMEKFPAYRVIIAEKEPGDANMLLVYGESKAVLFKAQHILSMIEISNPRIALVFRQYLRTTFRVDDYDAAERAATIQRLRELIAQI